MTRLVLFLQLALATSISMATEPFTLFTGQNGSVPQQPQACASDDGTIHVTFGVADQVYYGSIADERFSEPKPAFRVPNLSLGMRRGPRIAHVDKAIVITSIGGPQGKGRDGDIIAYRSVDGGISWLGPTRVNDVDASAREGLHAMTSSTDGRLWCVWLDLREKGTRLFASKSTDHGATWSRNVMVYQSPDGSVCECCHPSIVASGDAVHILFRNALRGDRDMYLISSHDGGETFGEAIQLGRKNWKLNACPMDGGMLVINNDGDVVTVWRRDRSIITATGEPNSESSLGLGEQPWIANWKSGVVTAWTTKRDGELLVETPESIHGPETLSHGASFPIVVAALGRKPSMYVFWDKHLGSVHSIEGKKIR